MPGNVQTRQASGPLHPRSWQLAGPLSTKKVLSLAVQRESFDHGVCSTQPSLPPIGSYEKERRYHAIKQIRLDV